MCFLTSTFRNDTRSRIGVLDVRTARGLNALSTIESVRFNVFLLADDVPSKSPVSRHVKRRLAINVNGSVAAAGEVGCRLSKAKLYLQQPDALEDGVSYENPHLFKSESQTSTDIPEPVPVAGYELEDEIVDIFDSLSGGPCGTLSECEIDSRITTQLLGYVLPPAVWLMVLVNSAGLKASEARGCVHDPYRNSFARLVETGQFVIVSPIASPDRTWLTMTLATSISLRV